MSNEFGYRITPDPGGFTVSATADRAPVHVSLGEWAWIIDGDTRYPGVGLVRTKLLVDEIAQRSCRELFGNSRPANVKVKYVRIPRAAASIHHRVLAEVKRLLDAVPDEVLSTQRAVFAATFTNRLDLMPELYKPEYAMLRRDIRQHRAAAAALVHAPQLAEQALKNEVEASAEFVAAAALAAKAGLRLNVGRDSFGFEGSIGDTHALDRLAADWRGVFSPTGRPYRSLDRTLMNLPGGVPAALLGYLGGIPLPRPVTDRVELVALLTAFAHVRDNPAARKHFRVFVHADRARIIRAMETVAGATRTAASPRRTADIARTVGYMLDYPGEHSGNVAGLARKSVRWHRVAAAREAAETVERLGNHPSAMPPIPLPDIPGVTFLADVAAIAGEGAAMRNCVASYASSAIAGHCYLFHAEHGGETATVEVGSTGHAAQAEGPSNKPNKAARWAQHVLSQWGRGFPADAPALPCPGDDPWAAGPGPF